MMHPLRRRSAAIGKGGLMPRYYLKVDGDDTEGHMPLRHLDAEGTEVTLRDSNGEQVSGHLRRGGDELIFDAEGDDTEGHKRYLDEGAEVTIRFIEGGDEVKGHIKRFAR
jgi:hypothetical protein